MSRIGQCVQLFVTLVQLPQKIARLLAPWPRATKRQRDKSTAFALTASVHVGRQVTFSPGADLMAAALTEGIHSGFHSVDLRVLMRPSASQLSGRLLGAK
jgi:hypothetical protein